MGLLDGKVVLVTGAGGGIGRAHALACAAEGAKIVVNDLGGTRDGTGASPMADAVVAEIVAAGGEAIADHGSVTSPADCAAMVAAALQRWGRLDVVVNNAGILRDKTFVKMTDAEWHPVIDVHLHGTRNVTAAAMDALKVRGGAIVNTTSYSGLIGNYGQGNYAAAKAGIYGLTRVLAMELRKAGITANCVAPVAKTRMTDDIAMVEEEWRPEQIAPIVVFLASDLARDVTGRVFGVQGQRIHLYEVKVNDGVEKAGEDLWTAEEIAARMPEITAFEAQPPTAAAAADAPARDLVSDVFDHFPAGFKAGAVPGWKAVIHWQVAGGTDQTIRVDGDAATVVHALDGAPTCTVKVGRDDLVAMMTGKLDPQKAFMGGKAVADNMGDLMKLAMAFDFKKVAASFEGAGAAPAPVAAAAPVAAPAEKAPPIGKRFTGGYWLVDQAETEAYARATDDLNPAYFGAGAIAPPMVHVKAVVPLMIRMVTDPELDLDLLRLVHGEHDVRLRRPLRHGDVLETRGELLAVEQKSSGLVARFGFYGFVDGQTALEGTTTVFIRGKSSGPKGERTAPAAPPPTPPAPDLVVAQPVSADQATRYAAASGDENPIHVDPATARAAGLPGVILHGLCTMAFAQRDLVDRLAGGDPTRLKRLAVRFAKPVFPGETLSLKVWGTAGEVCFTTENAAGAEVISNGIAEIGPA